MEPDPPAIASSQSEAKPATEKEHDGAIHCKVLDMKVKIDFNDKRSKFIQLLSMDDEEEVNIQAKASSPVEANQEDTSKPQPPSPLIESSMEEKEGRNESDAKCTVSDIDGDIVDGASQSQENTDSVIKKEEGIVVSDISPGEKTPQLVEEEETSPDKQLFWAGFSVKPDTDVDIENQVFKRIHARIEATEEKSDVLAVCRGITDDLSRIQNEIEGIVLEQNKSREIIREPDEDSAEENQLESLCESEQSWTGNQYRQIINGTVYYFDNSDAATKKNDQGKKEAEPEVNNNTLIDGEAFLANLKSKWMIEPNNDEPEAKTEDNTSEYIVCDPTEYGIVEQLHGDEDEEAREEDELSERRETSGDSSSSKAGEGCSLPALEKPDQKVEATMDSSNGCTNSENRLAAAIIDEKSETCSGSPTAAAIQETVKGSNEDPPTDPGMENNQRQARPNSANLGLEKNCNIDDNESLTSKDSNTKRKEVQFEDIAEDDLPPEKPISISKMKNEACKDLNIKPLEEEKAKRPKSSKTNQDKNLDIKLYLAEEKSRRRPKSGMDSRRGQGEERRQKDSEMKLANNEKPLRPKSAKNRSNRASPTLEEKQKLSNRPQSCRQRGKEVALTANFPSRNCKNIMELLTEADTDNLDFLNKREPVLPSKSYSGKSSML